MSKAVAAVNGKETRLLTHVLCPACICVCRSLSFWARAEFIKATGIQKQREAIEEKMKLQTAKQKMRERVNPKMGRMDIDYAILEDAFLRYQTKPKLTEHGDLYYEGKEFEVRACVHVCA